MKALTVQQPWAWAIVHGGKDVENRTQAWGYRGPLAIHAGARWSARGAESPLVQGAVWAFYGTTSPLEDHERWWSRESPGVLGAITGLVDLVDVHAASGGADGDPWSWCCRPWGEGPGVLLKANGKFTGPKTHLVLRNPRAIAEPVPCRGALGLWTVPSGVDDQVLAQVAEAG